jgi:L-histidine N-alpha-methyltransferase
MAWEASTGERSPVLLGPGRHGRVTRSAFVARTKASRNRAVTSAWARIEETGIYVGRTADAFRLNSWHGLFVGEVHRPDNSIGGRGTVPDPRSFPVAAIPSERDEDALHRPTLLSSIAGGRVPLKFAYVGRAAHSHDRYARTEDYAGMMASADRESEVLLESKCCDPAVTDLAEIGPGNGERSAALLSALRARGLPIRRYLGVDFSSTLLGISRRTIGDCFPDDLAIDTALWDAESSPAPVIENWRPANKAVLVCLVGGTLGNFENPLQAMRNIARMVRPGDLLLTSVLLRSQPDSINSSMSAYRTDEFRRAALEPMLTVGMSLNDLDLTIIYRDGSFVGEVTLTKDVRLGGLRLPRGHSFRCFVSRRFASGEVVGLLEQAGWSIYPAAVKSDSGHMTVVASRDEEPL